MLEPIELTQISHLDKKILAEAVNQYGIKQRVMHLSNPKVQRILKEYSLTISMYKLLCKEVNKKTYTTKEKELKKNKKLSLEPHFALIGLAALQENYTTLVDEYIQTRYRDLIAQIDSQLV
ncbi:hypothetical protein [Maribacter sp.]|uniref:hypothetical protein n=1 Tax=Maribacter sp. TaxID=1897614 RepID=UPI0025C4BD61|nr:hypothetical protein [Maribacter sp.]